MFSSLRARLIVSTFMLLVLFLGGAGWGLNKAFSNSVENGAREQLQLHLYSLLTAANEIDGKLYLPDALQEPRFNILSSGLYGAIIANNGKPLWRSESSLGFDFSSSKPLLPGKTSFATITLDGASLFQLSFGIVWEGARGEENTYTFIVMENTLRYQVQSAAFLDVLWKWLLGLGVLLLVAQWLVMQWGLSPLSILAKQVALIEQGESQRLEGDFPLEISPVVNNLNQLVAHEHRQRERYKHTMGDLAHSLKTPLAVLRGAGSVAKDKQDLSEAVEIQVKRMDQIVEYQLKRAVASGPVQLGKSIAIERTAEKLLSTLDKVYRDKQVKASIQSDLPGGSSLNFVGDEADLLEVLGNLLDNAYKHCDCVVRITLQEGRSHQQGIICIEDDGGGIPDHIGENVLARGVRADSVTPGQGIGLAVVQDIVTAYQGSIGIGHSIELGGASIRLELPCFVVSLEE